MILYDRVHSSLVCTDIITLYKLVTLPFTTNEIIYHFSVLLSLFSLIFYEIQVTQQLWEIHGLFIKHTSAGGRIVSKLGDANGLTSINIYFIYLNTQAIKS